MDAPTHNSKPAPLFGWPHYAAMGAGLVLFVLLFFVEKTAPLDDDAETTRPAEAAAAESKAEDAPPARLPAAQDPLGEIEEKKTALAEAASLDDSIKAYDALVEAYKKTGQYGYAARAQERAHLLNPTDAGLRAVGSLFGLAADNYRALGQQDLALDMNKQARAYYEKFMEKQPDNVEAKIELAVLRVNSEQPMAGIMELKGLAEQHPENYQAPLELGIFSLQTKQLEKAEQRLRTAIQIDPARWEGHFYLGLALRDLNRGEEARQSLEKALELAQIPNMKKMIESEIKKL